MKKELTKLLFALLLMSTLTSCYTYTFSVGNGAQKGAEVKGKNHYLILGLAELSTTDFKSLAGNATDYDVTIQHTFVDGLLAAITLGIYTPTTTFVKK